MRYRKLTSNGDYTFGNGQVDFYRDTPEAVAQAVMTRIKLWLGEWFLNIDEGTPYLTSIFGKHSKTEADITIQDRVQSTEGVVGIENYESEIDADTREFTVGMTINTIYGPSELQIENYRNF